MSPSRQSAINGSSGAHLTVIQFTLALNTRNSVLHCNASSFSPHFSSVQSEAILAAWDDASGLSPTLVETSSTEQVSHRDLAAMIAEAEVILLMFSLQLCRETYEDL